LRKTARRKKIEEMIERHPNSKVPKSTIEKGEEKHEKDSYAFTGISPLVGFKVAFIR
jgi:hypothetical protein